MSDLRRDYFVTRLLPLTEMNASALDEALEEVRSRARSQFAHERIDASQVRFECHGSLRYENQEHAVEVPLPGDRIDAASVGAIHEAFATLYEREYSYTLGAPVELVGIHLVATAAVGKLAPAKLRATGRRPEDARKGRRRVDYALEGVHDADVYAGEELEPGMDIAGPAIVESSGTTVVVHPGDEMTVDDYGNIVITIRGDTWTP